ncbi:efflux RND transporter periplasmic adaptor subunit [bacterium]|nr:efflux RND transporter periplasmic adaptor subunit [bacterium]
MKRKILVLAPLILILFGIVSMRLLSSFEDEKPKRNTQIKPRVVATEIVSLGDVPAKLTTFGTLASSQPISLTSEVSGTLQPGDIPFLPAQSFKKGDLLLKVDNRQINLEINSTKSDMLTALASFMPEIKVSSPQYYQVWQDYFDSINFEKSIAKLPNSKNQRIKALLARYNIYKLYFNVQNLEIRASKHLFYAPFNGSIVSTQLRAGSTASPGSRLAELINLEALEVEIQVPAQDIHWIDINVPVKLRPVGNGSEWLGHIDRIGKTIEDRTQSVLVYIKLDDTDKIHPFIGSFLAVDIAASTIPNAIKVPRRAVYEESHVFLVEDGQFSKREVGIAFDEGDYFIVKSGLSPGDTLVTELLQGISDGMAAKARENPVAKD